MWAEFCLKKGSQALHPDLRWLAVLWDPSAVLFHPQAPSRSLLLRLLVPLVSLEMFSKSRMYIKVFELGLIPLCESLAANLPVSKVARLLAIDNPSTCRAQSLEKAGRQLGLCFQ